MILAILYAIAAICAGLSSFAFFRQEGCPSYIAAVVALVYALAWPVAAIYIALALCCELITPEGEPNVEQ